VRTSLTRALIVGAVALSVALAGCSSSGAPEPSGSGEPKELTPFSFQLNNPPNGSNSGFAAAIEQGFYADAGLDVKIEPGTGSSQTVQMVAAGQGKIGYADSTAATQLIAQGAPLVVLATIYQSNPNEVIALSDSGIDSIADLKGKKVGTPVPSSQASMLPLFLESNGLDASDVELINLAPTSLVQSLLQNQVDAILGSIDTYQVQLEQQGAKDLFTAMFADNGVPTVSTSIFAQREYVEQNPELVSAFVRASLQGWEYATTNPKGAVADVKSVWGAQASVTTAEELDAILAGNLLCAGGAKYVGRAEPEQWELTQDLLSKVELLPTGIDPTDYYTYDFLPAEDDLQKCPIG
jgi:NitT/TauT family transport system substrate-binding protein